MTPQTIIIGSGIAGLNFALNAAQHGPVLIVTKKRTATSSTNRAQGGIAAVLDKTDNIEKHVQDTIEAGAGHNERDAVEFMIKKSPDAIRRLIQFGVPFATDEDGHLLLTKEGGHSERRIAFVGDYTGQEIEAALVRRISEHPNITVWEYAFAVDLLVKDQTCYGVQVIHDGAIHNLYAPNTVLATGGCGQLYHYTTNPVIATADGIGMGVRAGLKTKDMEFIQFHPTALKVKDRTTFLLSEALRGEGAHLINSKKERFMPPLHPQAELAPRDVVARAVYKTDLNGGAFLSLTHLNPKEIPLRFPRITQKCQEYHLDITQDPIPISPAAHYTCGGLITDLKGATSIQGLYAFGEVAWTGVHGANRLASNSLLEALVFSSQIVDQLPSQKLPHTLPHFPTPTYQPATESEWEQLKKDRESLQQLMWTHVGIHRTPQNLKKALAIINQKLSKLSSTAPLNVPQKENENMLLAAKEIIQAALKRPESLGCHHID